MPSQDSIEISSIFDQIKANNLKSCYLCFRTEEERKLVDPEHFKKCLHILRLQVPVVITICYVCESEATRAYSLFQAMNFASIVNHWFKSVANKIKYKNSIPLYLDRHITKHRRSAGKWPLPEWWRRLRARSDLVQTEVLIVSDSAMEIPDEKAVKRPPAPEPPRPPEPPPAPPKRAPEMDSIVIIDDDEDEHPASMSAPPPLTPAPPLAPPPERNVPTIVPLERLLDPSNTNTNEISLIPNDDVFAQNKDLTGYILQPLVIGPDGNYHIVSSVLENGQPQEANSETQFKEQDNYKVLEVGPIMENNKNFNIVGVQTLSDGVDVEGGKSSEVQRSAVMSGRIDWEDKIPMDVISFVDATDPLVNGTPSSHPRLGHYNRALEPRKRLKNDVIDLC